MECYFTLKWFHVIIILVENFDDRKPFLIVRCNEMGRVFNTTGVCIPEKHYMVNVNGRLQQIRMLVDEGKYFTINRARQYGKTTTLRALAEMLRDEYYVVLLDFQTFDNEKFSNGNVFSIAFANSFLRMLHRNCKTMNNEMVSVIEEMKKDADYANRYFSLKELFEGLSDICEAADRKIVLMIDEVDSAANNQVFIDFLAQLRAQYLDREFYPGFQSVILAGVHDIKNLKRKLRPEEGHRYNSPWNIAADFSIEMSFSESEIAGMLQEYEIDHRTGMNISKMSELLYAYTAGYPFLVSRICQLMDERVRDEYENLKLVWTENGFNEAVRILLAEKNPLFESLVGKICDYPELSVMLKTLLFTGRNIAYNPDETSIDMAQMFGFIKNQNGNVVIANRIFETRLYNYYLTEAKMQQTEIYKAALQDKSQFIVNGYLDMERILERFVVHFHDIYGESDEKFLEEQGRKFFLLYLKPIINGTGNYYIESRTRDLRRTDVIVDYRGQQYIIELKIWHGDEYNKRGEQQLIGYLEDYHVDKGYMLSFNFNRKKQSGIRKIIVNGKTIVEAVV